MDRRYGFAVGSGGRSVPTFCEYETISLMKKQSVWDTHSADDKLRATLYLETDVGRLICALMDAHGAASAMPGGSSAASILKTMLESEQAALMAVTSEAA